MLRKKLKNALICIGLASGVITFSSSDPAFCDWCHCTGRPGKYSVIPGWSESCNLGDPIPETWARTPYGCSWYLWNLSDYGQKNMLGMCKSYYNSCCCWESDPTNCWDGSGNRCSPLKVSKALITKGSQDLQTKRHGPPSGPNPVETAKHPFKPGTEKEIRHSPGH